MARLIQYEGRTIEVPDDFTDEEVAAVLTPKPIGPKLGPENQPPRTAGDAALDALRTGAGAVADVASYPGRKVEEATGAGERLGSWMAQGARQAGTPAVQPWGKARWHAPWQPPDKQIVEPSPVVTMEEQALNEERLQTLGRLMAGIAMDPLTYVGGGALRYGRGLLSALRGGGKGTTATAPMKALPQTAGGPYPEVLPPQKALPQYGGGPYPEGPSSASTVIRNPAGGLDTAGRRRIALPEGVKSPAPGTPAPPPNQAAPRPSTASQATAQPTASGVVTSPSTTTLGAAGAERRAKQLSLPLTGVAAAAPIPFLESSTAEAVPAPREVVPPRPSAQETVEPLEIPETDYEFFGDTQAAAQAPTRVADLAGQAVKASRSTALLRAEQAANEIQKASKLLQGTPSLSSKSIGKFAKAAEEYYVGNPELWEAVAPGGKLPQGTQLTDVVSDLIRTQYGDPKVQQILKNAGITPDEAAMLVRANVSEAARLLKATQNFQLAVGAQAAKGDKYAQDMISALHDVGQLTDDAFTPWYTGNVAKIENMRRLLMTMQPATAVRNAIANTGRIGLDVIENALSGVFAKAIGKPPLLSPNQGLEVLLRGMRSKETATAVDQLMEHFPTQRSRLYLGVTETQTLPGAAGAVGQALSKTQATLEWMNVLNRSQEMWYRRAVFAARLDDRLRKAGTSFDEVVKYNNIHAIQQNDISFAVKEALDLTWAKQPEFGTAGYHFVQFVNKSGLTTVMPFPRFFVNALQFTYEHSPMGILALLKPTERAAIAAGDMRKVARATEGTAMLLAAYSFRNSRWAGEQWYQIKDPESGKVIDMRAFQPFTTYFFLADTVKKYQEGRLHQADLKGMLKAMGQGTAGVGLETLDSAMEALSGMAKGEKPTAAGGFKGAAGAYVGSFATPLGAIVDLLDQFKNWSGHYAKEYDTRGTFEGPIFRNIPGLRETLPQRSLPTRPWGIEREMPILRQIAGLTVGPERTPFESFMESRGVSINQIFKGTGMPEWDELVNTLAYPAIKVRMETLVRRPDFQRYTPAQQGVIATQQLNEIHRQALDQAKRINPRLWRQMFLLSVSPEEIQAVKDRYRVVTPETLELFRREFKR